jgi:hypothetical protein
VKFVKRPEVVEAVQFTGINEAKVCAAAPGWLPFRNGAYLLLNRDGREIALRIGDWLLRDVTGRLSTCRDEVFGLLYEAMP